jgi:hypothetical protein
MYPVPRLCLLSHCFNEVAETFLSHRSVYTDLHATSHWLVTTLQLQPSLAGFTPGFVGIRRSSAMVRAHAEMFRNVIEYLRCVCGKAANRAGSAEWLRRLLTPQGGSFPDSRRMALPCPLRASCKH